MSDKKIDKLKFSSSKYQLALEALGDDYWEWNIQSNQIKYSKQWKKLFGFEGDEFEDTIEAWEGRVHNQDLNKTLQDRKDYISGKTEIYSNEHRVKCKNGIYKWVLDRGKIVEYSEDGSPLILVGIKTDISNQKLLKENLEKNKELTNSLLINIPGVAYRCLPDKDWTVKFLSSGISDLTGYDTSDFIDNKNKTFESIIFSSDKKNVRKSIENINSTNQVFSIEYRIVHKSGKLIWVKERGRGVFDNKNKLQFIDGIFFEITDRKEVEVELNKMNFQIIQAGKMARVGFWELNLINKSLYWSEITRKIHEIPKNTEIKLDEAINFYKEGKHREEIKQLVKNAIENGEPWETESKITTYRGKEIWVKSTGGAEIINGQCIRIFGSFQDINEIKINAKKLKMYKLLEKITNSIPGAVYQFEQKKDKSIKYKFLSENVRFLHKNLTKEAILANPLLPFSFIH